MDVEPHTGQLQWDVTSAVARGKGSLSVHISGGMPQLTMQGNYFADSESKEPSLRPRLEVLFE